MIGEYKLVAVMIGLVFLAALFAGCASTAPKFAAPTKTEWQAVDWDNCNYDSLAAAWAVKYPEVRVPEKGTKQGDVFAQNYASPMCDVPPKPGKMQKPKYPVGAVACAREGEVWVKVLVGVDGKVWDAVVYDPEENHQRFPFGPECLDAASKCIWQPARQKGKAVPVWAAYKITFKLDSESDQELAWEYCDSIARLNAKYTDLDKAPIPWDIKEVPCPDRAKKKDCNKGVWVRVLVDEYGTVTDAKLMNSDEKDTPEGLAALEAARQGVWEPAEKDGKKVKAWVAYKSEFE